MDSKKLSESKFCIFFSTTLGVSSSISYFKHSGDLKKGDAALEFMLCVSSL